jgi:hypothetical protein
VLPIPALLRRHLATGQPGANSTATRASAAQLSVIQLSVAQARDELRRSAFEPAQTLVPTVCLPGIRSGPLLLINLIARRAIYHVSTTLPASRRNLAYKLWVSSRPLDDLFSSERFRPHLRGRRNSTTNVQHWLSTDALKGQHSSVDISIIWISVCAERSFGEPQPVAIRNKRLRGFSLT